MKNKESHTQKDIYDIITPILEKNKVPNWKEISELIDDLSLEIINIEKI